MIIAVILDYIFMKTKNCPLLKVDNIKIKRNVSLFFLQSLIFLFLLPSLFFNVFFFIAYCGIKAFWSCEIKVRTADLVQSLDTVFTQAVKLQ